MLAFILAGGYGTRMRPYSDIVPKCLLPVKGIPCVRIIVDDLLQQAEHDGFEVEPVLCINERYEKHFRHEFRDVKNFRFNVTKEPKGTAGEVKAALESLSDNIFHSSDRVLLASDYLFDRNRINENIMVIYGDDLTQVKYSEIIRHHMTGKPKPIVTLVATTHVPLEYGVIDTQSDYETVIRIREKPLLGYPIWTGKCIISLKMTKMTESFYGKPFDLEIFKNDWDGMDLAKYVFPKILAEHPHSISCFSTDSLWLDIGNIGHYTQANEVYGKEGGDK